MVYDFQYTYLYQRPAFLATVLGLYAPVALLAVIVGVIDYLKKRFDRNFIKLAYYSVLFLLASCRTVLVAWVYEGHKGTVVYFDLPSLFLMALCSIVIYQVDKIFPSNSGMRRRRMVLILCNVIVCLANFSYYIFSGSMPPWQAVVMMSFMESLVLLVLVCVLVWSFRANWATSRFFGQMKLAGAFLCCGVCLLTRAAISISGVYTDFSPREKPSSSDSVDDSSILAPALVYYGVGECAVGYISLYIQYLLPTPAQSAEESTTIPLLRNFEKRKSRASELVADYYMLEEPRDIVISTEPSKNSNISKSPRNSTEIRSPHSSAVQDAIAAHEAQVLKYLTLFEKSLNATNVVLHEMLGKGGSGAIVYRCTLREGPFSGGTFAVKVMKDCVPADLDALMNEVRIYQSIKHNHIVKFMGADLSSPRREVRLFMEYIPQTLDMHIKKRSNFHMQYFTAAQISKYMLQIVSGLQVLHDRNIIHRDLKTSNIFVVAASNGDIADLKIGDFDVSTYLKIDKSRNRSGYHTANKGTEGFRAPEMVSRTLDKVKYDVKVDIWSLGMILYTFLTLQEPYENENRFERGWDTPPTLTADARMNARYTKLIHIFETCASPKPADRPSCSEIASLLQNVIASSL